MTLMPSTRRHLLALVAGLALWAAPALATENGDPVADHSRALIFGTPGEYHQALKAFKTRGEADVVPALVLALRFSQGSPYEISQVLEALTGHQASGWFDWMVWQQQHPEISPHASFSDLKLEVFRRLDPGFGRFFPDQATLDQLQIRLEEITWGGVSVDGIPALDHPALITAGQADYLNGDDLVFGVQINGDARAYPLRIMGWHEMFNEVIGGVPVALAYCTLCGSGILFETAVAGRDQPLVFGSSGLLYRSNKLMFDRATNSLWNQFTGRPVAGPLVGSGIELTIRPVAITSWAKWRAAHPQTRVLALETGHDRDYGAGVVYRDYFASPDLMFPAQVDQSRLGQKAYVFGIRAPGAAKAWPLAAFADGAVINDRIGQRPIVLIGDAATRTVRAYDRGEKEFQAGAAEGQLTSAGTPWRIGEAALIAPDGTQLARVPGHIAYWFAWNGYLGAESELYGGAE